MAKIGELTVDLTLKSAEFIRDLGKSSEAVATNTQRIAKSVNALAVGFGALFSARFIRQIERATAESIKLAATLHGPLGAAAKDFVEKAEAMSNAFQLGLAKGAIDSLTKGLEQSGISLQDLAAVGIAVGNVIGRVFTDIVNFLTVEIPQGVNESIDSLNNIIDGFNRLAKAREEAAKQPSALVPDIAGSALIGPDDIAASASGIDLINQSVIGAAKSWLDYSSAAQIAADAQSVTTEGLKQAAFAAEEFATLVKANEELFKNSRTPLEEYALALDKITTAHASGELAARAHQQAIANLVGNYLQLADNIGTALGTMFKESKAVAIVQAVINTAQAITKTFAEYGATPWGFALAASMAAIGAAQIAAIVSAQPGTSRATKVATSAGSAATATAGAASRTRVAPSQTVTINIEGEIFGPEHFRRVVAGINGVQKDGTALLRIA